MPSETHKRSSQEPLNTEIAVETFVSGEQLDTDIALPLPSIWYQVPGTFIGALVQTGMISGVEPAVKTTTVLLLLGEIIVLWSYKTSKGHSKVSNSCHVAVNFDVISHAFLGLPLYRTC
jgi:hypothetical protein